LRAFGLTGSAIPNSKAHLPSLWSPRRLLTTRLTGELIEGQFKDGKLVTAGPVQSKIRELLGA
jgi:hypothetical protein